MFSLICKLYWKFSGWKVVGIYPAHIKKMVIIIAPHTHWKDLFIGFASRNELKIKHAKFLGKEELFIGPLGWILKKLGGTPVDRFAKHGLVDQVVTMFNNNENFILALAPEGTRKKVNTLKSGFYHIAKKAHVPILTIGLDFGNKQLVIGEAFFTSEDENADFKKIISFFSKIKGANPNFDLRHLNND